MDETTNVTREEASKLTTMVVDALQKDSETLICDKMSNMTNRAADDNKVYLKLVGGEVYRFTVSPTRTRS